MPTLSVTEFPEEHVLAGYVTRKQLAAQLGRDERTLQVWEQRRIGPPLTRVGKQVLYRVDAVRVWLAAQEAAPLVRRRA